MQKGLFPGSFNPFHQGHLQVLKMALNDGFDVVYIVVAQNPQKPLNDLVANLNQIQTVIDTECLTARVKVILEPTNVPALANRLQIDTIIRGYRNQTDYQYEMKLKALYLQYNANLNFKFYQTPSAYHHWASSNK